MAWLLIDNSNTTTKFRLADANGLLGTTRFCRTAELSEEVFSRVLADHAIESVAVASVVSERAAMLEDFSSEAGMRFHRVTWKSPLGYGFGVSDPAEIGADRLVNVAAAVALGARSLVVVDFGTAVTFSVVSAENVFLGGVIAPGAKLMGESLASNTAQLPEIALEWPGQVIGEGTVTAMQSGVMVGQRELVRGILREIEDELGEPLFLVATGSGARFVAERVGVFDVIDEDFTLQGIHKVALRVFGQKG